MKNLDGIALAEFILASYPDKEISPMKLQKLAYYSKAWSLVAGEYFISAQFEKWSYGPVNCEIYAQYKQFGKNSIKDSVVAPALSADKENLLKFILNNYINYSAFALSAMTHNEEPWLNTPSNSIITDDILIAYYSKQQFSKNFKTDISKGGSFHVLQSDSWHGFTLDMPPEEAASFASYESYSEFQQQSEKAAQDCNQLINSLFN